MEAGCWVWWLGVKGGKVTLDTGRSWLAGLAQLTTPGCVGIPSRVHEASLGAQETFPLPSLGFCDGLVPSQAGAEGEEGH